jgi:putative photosynthetic complex assembly protein
MGRSPAAPEVFPRSFLMAVLAMAIGSLAFVALWSGAAPDSEATAKASSGRVLLHVQFVDLPDGSVQVRDARSGATVDTLVGEAGFVRSTVRGMANARKQQGAGAETPFVLVRRADGGINFEDPVTGRRISLEAFGSTNAAAFTRWLGASSAAEQQTH